MSGLFKKAKSKIHFATQGGSGSVLGASSESKPQGASPPAPSPVTSQPAARPQSSSSRSAGVAALSRFENKGPEPKGQKTSSTSRFEQVARVETGMLAEAKREVDREKRTQVAVDTLAVKVAKKLTTDNSTESVVAAGGYARVLVDCPVTGKTVEYGQRLAHLQDTLQEMYLQEPLYASCLMIHTLGTNSPLTTHLVGTTLGLIEKDKLTACIETLGKCLRNILEHPEEDKYRSIRCGSKSLKEKVLFVTGTELFLQAVGFVQEIREFQGNDEPFYVLPKLLTQKIDVNPGAEEIAVESPNEDGDKRTDDVNELITISDDDEVTKQTASTDVVVVVDEVAKLAEHLSTALDLLTSVSPIKLELNRDTHVYRACTSVHRFPDLPASFFILKPEELKKEHQLNREQVGINEMLLSRAQRDRLEQNAVRQYQFCVVRVRLPDGLVLQATFRAREKLSDLFSFISQSLSQEATLFSLFHQGGKKLENMNSSLQEANLVPAALVNMRIDMQTKTDSFLKPVLMRNIKRMS